MMLPSESPAVCPTCHGAGALQVDETGKPVGQVEPYPRWPSRYPGWVGCTNCGAGNSFEIGPGKTFARPDGSPCRHEFDRETAGRCYNVFTCRHCPARYAIDSSD